MAFMLLIVEKIPRMPLRTNIMPLTTIVAGFVAAANSTTDITELITFNICRRLERTPDKCCLSISLRVIF
jgi:hypothetical protein